MEMYEERVMFWRSFLTLVVTLSLLVFKWSTHGGFLLVTLGEEGISIGLLLLNYLVLSLGMMVIYWVLAVPLVFAAFTIFSGGYRNAYRAYGEAKIAEYNDSRSS